MNTNDTLAGNCLCGAVRVTATPKSRNIGVCHCVMCRTWGGGPFFSAECEKGIGFDGLENITIFSSSEWAERGFCRHCGTHLFYRLKHKQHYAIPIGLFDDGEKWTLTDQIFFDQKPAFYSFAEKTKNLTAEEIRVQNDK